MANKKNYPLRVWVMKIVYNDQREPEEKVYLVKKQADLESAYTREQLQGQAEVTLEEDERYLNWK